LDHAQLECDALTFAGDIEADLLVSLSLYPIRRDAGEYFLKNANANWSIVNELIAQKKLIEKMHNGHAFYMRRLASRM
jgi:hypothetical protein